MATTELDFDGLYFAPQQLIASGTPVTSGWENLGNEYHLAGVSNVGLYVSLTINDSTDVRFRLNALHTSGGTAYAMPIATASGTDVAVQAHYFELESDADQDIMLMLDLGGVVNYGRWQVEAGTVGGTPAQITDVWMLASR